MGGWLSGVTKGIGVPTWDGGLVGSQSPRVAVSLSQEPQSRLQTAVSAATGLGAARPWHCSFLPGVTPHGPHFPCLFC